MVPMRRPLSPTRPRDRRRMGRLPPLPRHERDGYGGERWKEGGGRRRVNGGCCGQLGTAIASAGKVVIHDAGGELLERLALVGAAAIARAAANWDRSSWRGIVLLSGWRSALRRRIL